MISTLLRSGRPGNMLAYKALRLQYQATKTALLIRVYRLAVLSAWVGDQAVHSPIWVVYVLRGLLRELNPRDIGKHPLLTLIA
jgi:hypothetical protein